MTTHRQSPNPLSDLARADLKHKLVLVIDDDADSLILLTRYIESLGCEVITAQTGQQGIYMATSYQPDLVVLDLQLPDMSGWEVLQHLKSDASTSHLKVVIISGNISDRGAGVLTDVDAIGKPIHPERLFEALRRNVRKSRGRVLIVDDNKDDRTLLVGYLRPHVESIAVASNGREGLERLEEFNPDLVLLDLMMPKMDGFQFIRAVRAHPDYVDLPILVITGKRLSDHEARIIQEHTQGLVGKRTELSKTLRRGLHRLLADSDAKKSSGQNT